MSQVEKQQLSEDITDPKHPTVPVVGAVFYTPHRTQRKQVQDKAQGCSPRKKKRTAL